MSLFDKAAGLATSLAAKAKAAARNITELELKVEEATNNDAWGPHGQVMSEIAQAALDVDKFNQIMGVVEARLLDRDENWRHVYKSLLLLEFLLRHGPLRTQEYLLQNKDSIEHLAERFEYRDPNGKDQGINVRQRAKELVALVNDPGRVRAEREKAAKNAGKYTGVSSSDFRANRVPNSMQSPQSSDKMTTSQSFTSPTPPKIQTSGSGAAEEDDPFEATRRRIQALKMEGAIPDGPISPVKATEEATDSGKKVKKLSDVAVDPSISAKLGGFAVFPSSSSTARTSSAGMNLLADFDSVSTAPASSMPAAPQSDWNAFEGPTTQATSFSQPAAPPPASAASDWNAFSSAAPVTAAAPAVAASGPADDWSGFASATSKPAPKNTAAIEAMLNIGSAPTPAGGPLPLEAFSSIPAVLPAGVRPPAGTMPPPQAAMSFDAFGTTSPAAMARPLGGGPLPMDAFSSLSPSAARPMAPGPMGAAAVRPGLPAGFQPGLMPMGPTPGFAGGRPAAPTGLGSFNDPFADPFSAPISNAPIMQTMPMTFGTTNKTSTPDKPKIGPEAAAAAKKKDPFSDLLSI